MPERVETARISKNLYQYRIAALSKMHNDGYLTEKEAFSLYEILDDFGETVTVRNTTYIEGRELEMRHNIYISVNRGDFYITTKMNNSKSYAYLNTINGDITI